MDGRHRHAAYGPQSLESDEALWVSLLVIGVLVGQALLPVQVCGGDIARDSQEFLSYRATWPTNGPKEHFTPRNVRW
jgi:hypothetical protein